MLGGDREAPPSLGGGALDEAKGEDGYKAMYTREAATADARVRDGARGARDWRNACECSSSSVIEKSTARQGESSEPQRS